MTQAQQKAYQYIFPPRLLVPGDLFQPIKDRQTQLETNLQAGRATFVAETDQNQIVGFASGGPKREGPADFDAELYNIFVLDDFQNQGVGRALFLQMAEFLQEQGYTALLLWVLQKASACTYYRHLQGQPVAERQETVANIPVVLECYGWHRLENLIQLLQAKT